MDRKVHLSPWSQRSLGIAYLFQLFRTQGGGGFHDGVTHQVFSFFLPENHQVMRIEVEPVLIREVGQMKHTHLQARGNTLGQVLFQGFTRLLRIDLPRPQNSLQEQEGYVIQTARRFLSPIKAFLPSLGSIPQER